VDLVSYLPTPPLWNKESKLNLVKPSYKNNSLLIAKRIKNSINMVATVEPLHMPSNSMKLSVWLRKKTIQLNTKQRNKTNARLTEPKLISNKLEPLLIQINMTPNNSRKLLKAMVPWLLVTMLQRTTIVIKMVSTIVRQLTTEELTTQSHSLAMVKILDLENGGKSKTPGDNGGVNQVT